MHRPRRSAGLAQSYNDSDDEGVIESKSHSPVQQSQVKPIKEASGAQAKIPVIQSSSSTDHFQHSFKYENDYTAKWELSRLQPPKEKEMANWLKLNVNARNQCVKGVVRLFLTRGARGEYVDRDKITAVLKSVDDSYKSQKNVVLYLAQQALYDNFGYILSPARSVLGNNDGKREEYYLSNALQNQALLKILSDNDLQTNAYRGFVFMVSQIIFSSPGRTVDGNTLLRQLRAVDNRFPETIVKKKSSASNCGIPELGDDFVGLMARLKKDGYVLAERDENNVDDAGKATYTLGPRFYNDIGKMQLLKSHFQAKGEGVPELLVNLINDEDTQYIAGLIEEIGEDNVVSATAQTQVATTSTSTAAASSSQPARNQREKRKPTENEVVEKKIKTK